MNEQCPQHRVAGMGVHKFIPMSFFPEMEMRGDGMLEEVDEHVSH